MKVILSRKGFDSGYGGHPSPILPTGEMLSMPIPVTAKDIPYSDIYINEEQTYEALVHQLYKGRLKVASEGQHDVESIYCHLDPDIRTEAYPRNEGWKAIFGQAGGSQTHLKNQGVGLGDLFLFFGWFRHTVVVKGKLKFDPKCPGFQAIYGYLQVGAMHQVNAMTTEDWMQYHPHVKRGMNAKDNDIVYSARKNLSFNTGLPGWGTLSFDASLKLTKDGYSRSRWALPSFMKHLKISHHSDKSWKDDYFQSAMIGQEFVFEDNDKARKWAESLIGRKVGSE